MNKKVYIFLADGFEDIEGLTVVDLMRRADIDIKTVSIKKSKEITTSHGITMLTDLTFAGNRFHGCGYAGTSGRNAGDAASERACRTLQTAESGRKEGKAHCGDLCSTECPWRTGNAERKKGMLLSVL